MAPKRYYFALRRAHKFVDHRADLAAQRNVPDMAELEASDEWLHLEPAAVLGINLAERTILHYHIGARRAVLEHRCHANYCFSGRGVAAGCAT